MNFWIRKKLTTHKISRKKIFPTYLRNLHDILRNEKDDVSDLKKR